MTTARHVHWHRPVAAVGRHLYYQCRCGSRRHGVRTTGPHASLDQQWLAGGEWTTPPDPIKPKEG